MRSVWLMYHNVFSEEALSHVPPSASVYHLSRSHFIRHLETIQASRLRVLSVSEWLENDKQEAIVLTFDDGWRGSFEVAIPEICRRGWKATFYVTRDFIGRNGFCDNQMLKDAVAEGMEIGVHGTTHRTLSGLAYDEVAEEFRHCKQHLEQILGIPIVHASLPGGGLNHTVVSAAVETGLESLSTSKPGINSPGHSPMLLNRVAIKDSSSVEDIRRYCEFNVWREASRSRALQVPKFLLGMKIYGRFRRWFMDERTGTSATSFDR